MVEFQPARIKPLSRSNIVTSEEMLGEELFLYDETNGSVHTLNSGAAMVWLLCDGSQDLEEMSAEIASVSGLSQEDALAKVQKTVGQFRDLGLL